MPSGCTERAARHFAEWCYKDTLVLNEAECGDSSLLTELINLCWLMGEGEELQAGSWVFSVVSAIAKNLSGPLVLSLWPLLVDETRCLRPSCKTLRQHCLAFMLMANEVTSDERMQGDVDKLLVETPRPVLVDTLRSLPTPQKCSASSEGKSDSAEGKKTEGQDSEELRQLMPEYMAATCPEMVKTEIEATNKLLGSAVLKMRLSSNVASRCKEIVNRATQQKDSFWFWNPVDEVQSGAIGYYEIIKHPMDLTTLRKQYLSGSRNPSLTLLDFVNDGRTIWQNSFRFNAPSTDPFIAAQILALFWEKRVRHYFSHYRNNAGLNSPQSSSSSMSLAGEIAVDLPLSLSEYQGLAQKLPKLCAASQDKFFSMASAAAAPSAKDDAGQGGADSRQASREVDLALIPPAKMRELASYVDREYQTLTHSDSK